MYDFYSKTLTEPGVFPLVLQDDELGWQLAADYCVEDDKFILFVNGRAFLTLPYKASLDTTVPQSIESGKITLNGVQVHSGFKQYTEETFFEWLDEHDIESVTEAIIGSNFACSSSAALNSVFDDLGRYIIEEEGLKKLTFGGFADKNNLEEWPLSQLLIKSPNLEELTIDYLEETTGENIISILEFAGKAVTNSSCLHTLYIDYTCSSAEDGDKLMKVLADHHIDWLQNITIIEEYPWFENDRDGCMVPLLVLLARQTSLKTLKMYNNLSDAQKDQIRKVVSENAPECTMDGEIKVVAKKGK